MAALTYLGCYAASESSLRRMLENRIRRAAFRHTAFAADKEAQAKLRAAIETIIAKHRRMGILNDAAYAAMKTASARRSGKSARTIRLKLGQKGVAREAIEKALSNSAEGEDAIEAELKAARTLARRRKWGLFRGKPADPLMQRKEFAAMARAGFSLDVIRQVLGKGTESEDD
jgi:regulatory protein